MPIRRSLEGQRDDVGIGKDGRPPTEAEMQQFFNPFSAFCASQGVRTKEVVLQDSDVSNALIIYINMNAISHVVVGSPSRKSLTRAFKSNSDVATSLQRSLPDTCNLYVVSKTKNQKTKSAIQTPVPILVSMKGTQSLPKEVDLRWKSNSISGSTGFRRISFARNSTRRVDDSDFMPVAPRHKYLGSKTLPGDFATISNNQLHGHITQRSNLDDRSDLSDLGTLNSHADLPYGVLKKSQTSDSSGPSISSQHVDLEDEICRIRIELRKIMDMYHLACKEAASAEQKASEIDQWMFAEACQCEEFMAAKAALEAILEMEKQKGKAAIEAALMAQSLVELEVQKRIKAEVKAEHEATERQKLMVSSPRCNIQCRKYMIEDIEIATDYFSNSLKIGEGGYGPVFRGYLDHTAVAIKVLRPDISQGQSQFQQEVEILSSMRHPHMVLLLGACPEYGCLIYEYMENGSLEDRLLRKSNTPPIPWGVRFKMCTEIATALHFLHQTRPQPLVHRDLKPGNILLDRNYVSKISDVGLARLVPPEVAEESTQYHITAAAGTFCYIDPEYQQTGILGTKSDIYSFGVILLQVITAKSPMGITHQVSKAIKEGTLLEVLDPAVTDWPLEDTLSLAKLALQCCELRKKDRPDLGSVILPQLKRLRDLGNAL